MFFVYLLFMMSKLFDFAAQKSIDEGRGFLNE